MEFNYERINNLFETIRLSSNIKLVIMTGTEKHGEIFLINYYDGQFLCEIESLKDNHAGKCNVESAHEFMEEIISDQFIAAIELEDNFKNRISVFHQN